MILVLIVRSSDKRSKELVYLLLIVIWFIACTKDWLEAKPNKALVVPTTIQDYQALLDNSNNLYNFQSPSLQEVSTDDFYLPYANWQIQSNIEKNAYLWASELYEGGNLVDWNYCYERILRSNIALEGIHEVPFDGSSFQEWTNVKGTALFFRAFDFYNLAQLFCKPYTESTASTEIGIPLRLTANINDRSARASVEQTYEQIIKDLKEAVQLLPKSPTYLTRPSTGAAYGLLARTYLTMENYANAKLYADSCLMQKNNLQEYNLLDPSAYDPIPRFNPEVIFHYTGLLYTSIFVVDAVVDSVLYNSYADNDLRKTVFFKEYAGFPRFWGNYGGALDGLIFTGLATDEIYLIRAECFAREGNSTKAMNDLNTLLAKRWKTGTFIPYTAGNAEDALRQILIERRKELLFRGLRWSDLRRLNKDTRFATTLTRQLNGQNYSLPPNDLRYVLPIPDNEIKLSNIEQNPR